MFILYQSTSTVDRYEVIGIYSTYKKIIDYIKNDHKSNVETSYFFAEKRRLDSQYNVEFSLSFSFSSLDKEEAMGIALITSNTTNNLNTEQHNFMREVKEYADSNNG